MTPLEEDGIILAAAESIGIHDCYRRRVIDVDARELPACYFRRSPDYQAIRRALEDGVTIPGARLTDQIEYVLRRAE